MNISRNIWYVDCRYFSVINSINQSCVAFTAFMYVIFSMYLLISKLQKKISKNAQNPLVFSMKNAQNLYLSISKFSRDSRRAIKFPGLRD